MLPPRLLPPGTWLTRDLEITGVLGEGGMAVVYRGIDHAARADVAVKILHANLLGDRALRRRFRREAELMASWRHPNVVEVHRLIEDERVFAAVMELVTGPTLDGLLRERGPLRGAGLRAVFVPILDAVQWAHERGVIHRDLKPKNVLVAAGSVPKVSDFGIAKTDDGHSLTETGSLLGSCRYMAPEQAQSAADVDHRADIYSLGVMLHYAVTGRCPFEGRNPLQILMAHVSQPAPAANVSPEIDALILAALAKDPAARPQSCRAFAAELERCAA